MYRKLPLAVMLACCWIALAQPQTQPSTQAQPQPSPSPSQSSLAPLPSRPIGKDGVIGGIIAASPSVTQSWRGKMSVSFKLKKDGSLDELHPYYQDPDSQRVATQEHPELEQKVLENMRQWKYSPFLLEGNPVEVRTGVVLQFDLEKPDGTLQMSLFSVSPSSPYSDFGRAKLPYALRSWLELDGETMNSIRVHYEAPNYPQMARIAHINGKVVVRIRVDKEGRVAEEKGVSGHPILVQSVLDAVKKWQYRPVVVNGQPMEVLSYVAVGFNQ